jgi:hypothetical protein
VHRQDCFGRLSPPLSLRGGVTFELWARLEQGLCHPVVLGAIDGISWENGPLLVSAELARPPITQQVGSEFHPASVTTINARLPVSKRSHPVCRKLGAASSKCYDQSTYCECPSFESQYIVVLRLTTHVYKAHYRARAFWTRETGHPSAGFTCSSPGPSAVTT